MNNNYFSNLLKTKKIAIAGCGGLGSNCAVALARVGIGNLIIVDFDKIELSNLNRQYYFHDQIGQPKCYALQEIINRIDKSIKVEPHQLKLNSSNIPTLFSDCDVIVEAFDLADQKKMFVETVLEKLPEIPLVIGLGMAGYGNNNTIQTQQDGNIYICGDQHSEISDERPPLAPRVGIVANMQANQVLEILLGKTE